MRTAQIYLWDIAGVDGLQAMKFLVGDAIDRISPFRSLETQVAQTDCSVLRLCEANFRISCRQPGFQITAALNALPVQRIWIKQFDWLGSLILPEADADRLIANAVPKPPHRLENLPLHCAAPARINGISVLIWRHPIAETPVFELHTARSDLPRLQRLLEMFGQY